MEVLPAHCYACYDALLALLDSADAVPRRVDAVTRRVRPFPDHAAGGLFVTWTRTLDGRLRGCLGSLSPLCLATGLPEYARLSARDSRFPPITLAEVSGLDCAVSVLHSFERGRDWQDWEVGRHGVSITLAARDAPGGAWKATYLPEIAQREGWSRRETMESLLRKAGFKGRVGEALLLSIVLTRYQSSKGSCTYADYVNAGAVEDAARPEAVGEAAPALAVQRI